MPHLTALKRLSSILFLLVLIFNLWGYRLMIDCLQQKQELQLSARLDANQYNEKELISIKTSLNLPYYTSSETYERAYGSIHVNGVDYEYVKRRVYNDTLELLCLPNKVKTNLQAVKNLFYRFSTDDQSTQPNKKSHTILKSSLPDFVQEIKTVGLPSMPALSVTLLTSNTSLVLAGFVTMQDRPPRTMQLCM